METNIQEMNYLIVCQIKESDCELNPNPPEVRLAHVWLSIESEMKGQKWYLKDMFDRGKIFVVAEEDKNYWVYETRIAITLDDARPTNYNALSLWLLINSQNPPRFVKLLKSGEVRDEEGVFIPRVLRELWEKVEAA